MTVVFVMFFPRMAKSTSEPFLLFPIALEPKIRAVSISGNLSKASRTDLTWVGFWTRRVNRV